MRRVVWISFPIVCNSFLSHPLASGSRFCSRFTASLDRTSFARNNELKTEYTQHWCVFLICLNWMFYGITCKKWTTFHTHWKNIWSHSQMTGFLDLRVGATPLKHDSTTTTSVATATPEWRWQKWRSFPNLKYVQQYIFSIQDVFGLARPHFLMKSWFPFVHEAYTFHCLRYFTGLPDFHPKKRPVVDNKENLFPLGLVQNGPNMPWRTLQNKWKI